MSATDKKDNLVHITMRIPAKTWEYFQSLSHSPRSEMRAVLDGYVRDQGK